MQLFSPATQSRRAMQSSSPATQSRGGKSANENSPRHFSAAFSQEAADAHRFRVRILPAEKVYPAAPPRCSGRTPSIRPETTSDLRIPWLMNMANPSGLSAFFAACRHSLLPVKPLSLKRCGRIQLWRCVRTQTTGGISMQMQATAGYAGGQIPNPYMAYGAPVGFAPLTYEAGVYLPTRPAGAGCAGCRPSAAGSSPCRHCLP